MFPLLLLVPMVIAMLWMNSKQQKKQKELEESLKTGDRVVTTSGLIGKLTDLGGRYVKVEIAPGIKVQMLRTAIASLDSGEEKPTAKADVKTDERVEEKKPSAKADEKKKADDKPKADDKARSKPDSASK